MGQIKVRDRKLDAVFDGVLVLLKDRGRRLEDIKLYRKLENRVVAFESYIKKQKEQSP